MAATLTRSRLSLGRAIIRHNAPRAMAVFGRQQQTRSNHVYSLPDLDYDYGDLEPYISAEIMQLHHTKHHQTYITNFNKAVEQFHSAKNPQAIVGLQSAINFNGGGHVNHSIFWKNLAPQKEGGGEGPTGKLASAINEQFGSLDKIIARINIEGAALQGSGWVWLGLNKDFRSLVIATTLNQDTLASQGLVPLLGIDVWEHAYYLQYKNIRPDYLKNIWKVVNWKDVAARYERHV